MALADLSLEDTKLVEEIRHRAFAEGVRHAARHQFTLKQVEEAWKVLSEFEPAFK